jgi:hypothetical protein
MACLRRTRLGARRSCPCRPHRRRIARSAPQGTPTKMPSNGHAARPSGVTARQALQPNHPPRWCRPRTPRTPGCPLESDFRSPASTGAALLKRIHDVDALACPCGGRLRLVSLILDESVARCMLRSLGLPSDSPPSLARAGRTYAIRSTRSREFAHQAQRGGRRARSSALWITSAARLASRIA